MSDPIIERILTFMNRILALDSNAIELLFSYRVDCNSDLANDSEVQVRYHKHSEHGDIYSLGMLGIICGIAGVHPNGYSKICAVYDVVCPTHGKIDVPLGNLCPHCSIPVKQGKLLRFEAIHIKDYK